MLTRINQSPYLNDHSAFPLGLAGRTVPRDPKADGPHGPRSPLVGQAPYGVGHDGAVAHIATEAGIVAPTNTRRACPFPVLVIDPSRTGTDSGGQPNTTGPV